MTATIERNPKVVYRDLRPDEGGVLLHLRTGAYHGVNATGATIWRLLDTPRTHLDLVAELRGQFPDAPQDLEHVVEGFLEELRARDLVSPCGEYPTP
jgi:hypothetical protein